MYTYKHVQVDIKKVSFQIENISKTNAFMSTTCTQQICVNNLKFCIINLNIIFTQSIEHAWEVFYRVQCVIHLVL